MFDIETAPIDPILGLTEAFRADRHPDKINLGVGVYQSDDGVTPIMRAVKEAERRLLETESTKSYLSIPGHAALPALVRALLLGERHPLIDSGRVATAQTPGGTGALRVAADFLKRAGPGAAVWLSTPTWANHRAIFRAAGLEVDSYPYYDAARQSLDRDACLARLADVPAGDVVVLHGCCHNPSGVDPDMQTWAEIGRIAARARWLPLFDFAYQGLGDGLAEDRRGVAAVLENDLPAFICSSFSKNFGLYNERIGALSFIGEDRDETERVFSNLKVAVRASYSNPPAHGGSIVAEVLSDPVLKADWEDELNAMRERIAAMRRRLADGLAARGAAGDFDFVTRQRGLFSFLGLTSRQVDALREKHHVYAVRSGRVNVAGITPANADRLCDALADVLADASR